MGIRDGFKVLEVFFSLGILGIKFLLRLLVRIEKFSGGVFLGEFGLVS